MWNCLRCACFLRVRGASAACAGVAADILRDGHGQDVGRHLHYRLKTPNVTPPSDNSGDGKVELALSGAARAEQPELEPLLIICARGQITLVKSQLSTITADTSLIVALLLPWSHCFRDSVTSKESHLSFHWLLTKREAR